MGVWAETSVSSSQRPREPIGLDLFSPGCSVFTEFFGKFWLFILFFFYLLAFPFSFSFFFLFLFFIILFVLFDTVFLLVSLEASFRPRIIILGKKPASPLLLQDVYILIHIFSSRWCGDNTPWQAGVHDNITEKEIHKLGGIPLSLKAIGLLRFPDDCYLW